MSRARGESEEELGLVAHSQAPEINLRCQPPKQAQQQPESYHVPSLLYKVRADNLSVSPFVFKE